MQKCLKMAYFWELFWVIVSIEFRPRLTNIAVKITQSGQSQSRARIPQLLQTICEVQRPAEDVGNNDKIA